MLYEIKKERYKKLEISSSFILESVLSEYGKYDQKRLSIIVNDKGICLNKEMIQMQMGNINSIESFPFGKLYAGNGIIRLVPDNRNYFIIGMSKDMGVIMNIERLIALEGVDIITAIRIGESVYLRYQGDGVIVLNSPVSPEHVREIAVSEISTLKLLATSVLMWSTSLEMEEEMQGGDSDYMLNTFRGNGIVWSLT